VCTSDEQFFSAKHSTIDRFFLDPFTALNPDFTPRSFLVGREADIFILDFFGRKANMKEWSAANTIG
jgi:hypothetical protein